MSRYVTQSWNKNARIVTRIDRSGKLRTETQRRDEGSLAMAVSTDSRNDSTSLFIDFPEFDDTVQLSGREARSLYRLLRRHYSRAGKTVRA